MSAEPQRSDHLDEIQQRAALFESIIESMGESVLVVDRAGEQVYANRMLRHFSGEAGPGGRIDDWRSPAVMKIFDADGHELPPDQWPVARALRGDYADNFEIRVQGMAHRPGITVLSISTRSLVGVDGEIEGAVIVTRDITTQRQTEDTLRQSQKLETIGQFTGGIAHDFNNMLAAILSAAEVLKRGVAGNAKLDLAASTVEKAALRGADLTRHLLAFARKQALMPVAVDVDALVHETQMLLRPALGETIETTVISPGAIYARADAAQLTSALLNLCLNARDAMPEGGKLTISVEPTSDGFVSISVADTGCGMSEETLRRATEPFFTTKGVGKGSGLGLSMIYGFVHQSGGDLRIKSTEGAGATCTMLLPRVGAPASAEPRAENRLEPTGKLRVLIVDDDELVRDALSLQLSDEGFSTVTANDGPAALALMEEGLTFDIVLADMVMPRGMTGVVLAREIRKQRPNVRAIISTGYVDRDVEVGDGGKWLLLRKPYSSAELFAALRAVMLGQG